MRKHGGRQDGGWSFDLVHLHAKSGSLSPLKHFCYDVRQIVGRQTLPGYELVLSRDPNGTERLNFTPTPRRLPDSETSQARSHSKAERTSVRIERFLPLIDPGETMSSPLCRLTDRGQHRG